MELDGNNNNNNNNTPRTNIVLLILAGLPACGKTSFARKFTHLMNKNNNKSNNSNSNNSNSNNSNNNNNNNSNNTKKNKFKSKREQKQYELVIKCLLAPFYGKNISNKAAVAVHLISFDSLFEELFQKQYLINNNNNNNKLT